MRKTIILRKPIITEKSLLDTQKYIYTFEVEKDASKPEITEAIEKLFKVHVIKITTVIVKGKRKLVGKKRNVVKQQDKKKARIHLKKGEKIEFFETGETK